jgi:Uma2 family endonuclease
VVFVAEYLSTVYRPDCEYVDGKVIERNVGEYGHSRLQISLASWLRAQEKALGIHALTEQQSQRYRVPDICVLRDDSPRSRIICEAPFVCIEILSRDDRMAQVQERVDDYLMMGVSFVWVVDPQSKHCYIYSGDQLEHNREGLLYTRNPEIRITVDEVLGQ